MNKETVNEICGSYCRSKVIMTTSQILIKYPYKNQAWNLNDKGDTFFADASSLSHTASYNGWLDPWNRPMHQQNMLRDIDYNADGDIVGWKGQTTVEGNRVNLIVFNT